MAGRKKQGQTVSFSCQNIEQNCNYVYWYQKEEKKTFILILRIQNGYCNVYSDYNHPQKEEFSVIKQKNNCNLRIKSVKVSHSATYYCTCWDSLFLCVLWFYYYANGGSTQDNPVRKPKVTVYPASNHESNGKTTLLCLARDMFPDLVKISWKMEDEYGQTVEVPKAETEQLEQREEGQTTSMIIVDKENACKNKYRCYVEHEGVTQDVDILKVVVPIYC
uniref:Ig-like domain-containing protein n=1 Tax=Hucho hucho TaxID=62062 RepID=A0A4W5LCZ2_9TELE